MAAIKVFSSDGVKTVKPLTNVSDLEFDPEISEEAEEFNTLFQTDAKM